MPDTQVLSDDAHTKSGMETLTPLSMLSSSFRSTTASGSKTLTRPLGECWKGEIV